MSLESIFTPEQIDALSKAPLDVAVLAAEADFELEDDSKRSPGWIRYQKRIK